MPPKSTAFRASTGPNKRTRTPANKKTETAQTAKPPTPGKEAPASPLQFVYALWKLKELEQHIAELLRTEHQATVSQLATALKKPVGEILGLLGPRQVLRGAAIIETETSAELGYPRPSDVLSLGRGLLVAAQDRTAPPGHIPGLSMFAAPLPDSQWAGELLVDRPAQAMLDLVKDKLVGLKPPLLLLSQCSGEIAGFVAQAVRLKLGRPVLYLEASCLAGFPAPDILSALRRLRRDADLRGAALVVQDTDLLGGVWRVLAQPKPSGQTSPVVLCSSGLLSFSKQDDGASFEASYGAPLQVLSHALRSPGMQTPGHAAGGVNGGTAANDDPLPTDADRSREEARRQAALDAARAMGKPIPKELLQPISSGAPTGPATNAQTPGTAALAKPVPSQVHPNPELQKTEQKQIPVAPVEIGKTETTKPAPVAQASSRPMNPRLAAALAKAGLPPPAHTAQEEPAPAAARPRAMETAETSNPKSAGVPVAQAAQPTPPQEEALSLSASSPETTRAAADATNAEDGPPLPLAEDAKLDDLILCAKTTTSMRQRAEILRRLAGTRSPHVIQLFRSFVSSPVDIVRLAAEEGMTSLFGNNWNRARTIAPPIQPPRTDDGGRGPGGAF